MHTLWAKFSAMPLAERPMSWTEAFRKFAWLLDSEQHAMVDQVVNSGIMSFSGKFSAICDKSMAAAAAEVSVMTSSSSSSSSREIALHSIAPSMDSKSKKEAEAAETLTENTDKLMAMFKRG